MGLTVTYDEIPLVSTDNPWNREENKYKTAAEAAAAYLPDPDNRTWDAIVLDSNAETVSAVLGELLLLDSSLGNRIWVGNAAVFEDLVDTSGGVFAGIHQVVPAEVDKSHAAYLAFVEDFKAAHNGAGPTQDFSWQVYAATLYGLFAAHAVGCGDGPATLAKLLDITAPAAGATPYWVSDVKEVRDAIDAGEAVDIEGLGMPFGFSDAPESAGRSFNDFEVHVCCDGTEPQTTSLTAVAVADAAAGN